MGDNHEDIDFDALARDGWRVEAGDADGAFTVSILLMLDGKTVESIELWNSTDHTRATAADVSVEGEWHRYTDLVAGVISFLNSGGDLGKVFTLIRRLDGLGMTRVLPDMQLVAVETEVETLRTYLLPDGDYVRVVADEFAERLSPGSMHRVLEGESEDEDSIVQPL